MELVSPLSVKGILEESKGEVVQRFSPSSPIIVPPRPNTARLAYWTRSLNFTSSSNKPLPPLNINLNSYEALRHIDEFEYGRWDLRWRVLHRHTKRSNRSEVWGSLWQSRFHQHRGLVLIDILLWKSRQYPHWSHDGTVRKNNLPSIIESVLRSATDCSPEEGSMVLAVTESCPSKLR